MPQVHPSIFCIAYLHRVIGGLESIPEHSGHKQRTFWMGQLNKCLWRPCKIQMAVGTEATILPPVSSYFFFIPKLSFAFSFIVLHLTVNWGNAACIYIQIFGLKVKCSCLKLMFQLLFHLGPFLHQQSTKVIECLELSNEKMASSSQIQIATILKQRNSNGHCSRMF